MKTGNFMKVSGLTLCSLLALPFASQAAGGAPVYNLNEVVVTATKLAEAPEKVPASVSVVTSQDIAKHNYNSTAQALGQLPGVYLSPLEDGGITMRGFSSSNILVMVDGQPVNNGWNGSVDWSMIPVENIDRIEVVRGAASSLYGGRAVGGVIQIVTKSHKDGLHGDVVLSYGSHDTTKQVYDASFKKNKWDIGVGYEKRKTDGWRGYYVEERASSPTLDPNVQTNLDTSARDRYIVGGRGKRATDTESWHIKASYHFDDDKSLTYSYFHTNYSSIYNHPFSYIRDNEGNELFYGSVTLPNGRGFDIYPGDFLGYVNKKEWSVHNFAYDDNKNMLHARFGITDVKKDGYSSTSGPERPITASELQHWNGEGTQSFYPSKNRDFDLHKAWNIGKHTLLAGMAYRSESFKQTRYDLRHWRNHGGEKSAYEKHGGKDEAWAGYLQDKWQINDRLALYGGVRFDRFKKKNGYGEYLNTGVRRTYDEATYTEWSPKFSLEYSFPNDTTLYASYGHSFTPPILSRVYRDEGAQIQNIGGQLTVRRRGSLANPSLKPETTDTYEIGIKKKWGNKTSASIAYYRAKTDDAIRYFSTSRPTMMNGILYQRGFTQYRNFGNADKHGIEIDFNHKFNNAWSTYLNYAWELEKIDGEHNYDIPRHTLHFGARYNLNKWDILADAEFISARQSPDDVSGRYYAEDPFFIANLSTNYSFAPNASVQFSIYNIFNRKFYASEAAGERTYTVSMRYNF